MSSDGGGGAVTTTASNTTPWAGAQPYLLDLMAKARKQFEGGVGQNYFPGSAVVPFSNQTNQALQMREARANAGSPITGAAQQLAQRTLGGQYLDPTQNPAYQVMAGDVTDKVNSAFGMAGRTGSPAHQQSIARGITQGGAGIYDQERQRMMQMLGLSGEIGNMDLQNSDLLAQVGAQREALGAQQLQDLMARFQFSQTAPWDVLKSYSGVVTGLGGTGGSTTGTSTGPAPNRALGALSGAAGGASVGDLMGHPGWGAALGGLLGVL